MSGLDNIGKELMEEIDTLLGVSAGEMLQLAAQRVPVDKGELAASLEAKQVLKREGKVTYNVDTDVEYAIHVEYGTENMEAQPFLRPALDKVRGNLKLDLKALGN